MKVGPRLYFDLETDGLLDAVSVIHSLVIEDLDTGEVYSCCNTPSHGQYDLLEGLALLATASELIGHNIIGYDLPVIRKLYPKWKHSALIIDTLISARLMFGDMRDRDFGVRERQIRKGLAPSLPGNLIGTHRLEAWGYRLGQMKGDYSVIMKERGEDPWAKWNPLMQEYCEQDVRVTKALYEMLVSRGLREAWWKAADIEMRFASLIQLQERHGFRFDVKAAEKLEATIRVEKAKAEDTLYSLFKPWWVKTGEVTPDEDSKRWVTEDFGGLERIEKVPTGETYVHTFKNGKTQVRNRTTEVAKAGFYQHTTEGGTYSKCELRIFNPSSRQHIADRLMTLYGWKPDEFTSSGEPVVDDEVLSALPYPPAQALAKYFMLEKRLGQLADGKQAWLKVQKNGRIHGRVNTLGAVTGRCTHSDPNIAQVPSIENAKGKVPYGAECRALFLPDEGHVLIGCDADGLELRCLAHFMKDGGRYSRIVDEGNKDEGTDIHTMNMKAAKLESRANAKTFIYAFLYGAGDAKIGSIVGGGSKAGKALKEQFLAGTPGLGGLINACKQAARVKGWIKGIDGREVPIRHQHAALNSLLQNAGAVAMKLAPVLLYERLTAEGYEFGKDWAQVAHIHDEVQLTSRPEHSDYIKQVAVWSIEEAGRQLGFNCPLRGSAGEGSSWKETH